MSFLNDLKNAESNAASDAPKPGLYNVAIDTMETFTSKDGRDFIRWAYTVTSPPAARDHHWDGIIGLTGNAAPVARGHCEQLGIKVDEIASEDALDQALRATVGRYASVEVKRKGEYVNTYMVGLAKGDPPASDVRSDTRDFEQPQQGDPNEAGEPIPF